MKALKSISLVIISIFLFISIATLLMSIAIRNTYFSSTYFNEVYDKSNANDALDDLLFKELKLDRSIMNIDNSSDNKSIIDLNKSMNEIELNAINSLNNDWLKKEIPNVSKGYFAYFLGDKKELYPIDFKAPKNILKEMSSKMIEKTISYKEISDRLDSYIEKVNKGLANESKLGLSRAKTIDLLMNDSLVKDLNINKDEVSQIIEKVNTFDFKKLSKEEIYKDITTIIYDENKKVDALKDTLDFNAVLDNKFGVTQNPFKAAKNFLTEIKNQLIWFPLIAVAIMLLLIWCITFRLYRFLKWVGINLIGAGLILILINPLMIFGVHQALVEEIKDNEILLRAVNEFLSKPFSVSFVLGILSLLAGIFLLIFSALKNKHHFPKSTMNPRKTKIIRIVSIIILVVLLPFNIMLNTIFIVNSADKMNKILKNFNDKGGMNIEKILKEDMGWDFSAK